MQAKLKLCFGCERMRPIWKNVDGNRYCKECAAKLPKQPKPTEKAKQCRIPARSSKKEKEDALYSILRKNYLTNHPMCEMAIPGICEGKACDIQHLEGRVGDNYLDDMEWKSACRACHTYVELHPEYAKEQGFAKLRLKKDDTKSEDAN